MRWLLVWPNLASTRPDVTCLHKSGGWIRMLTWSVWGDVQDVQKHLYNGGLGFEMQKTRLWWSCPFEKR